MEKKQEINNEFKATAPDYKGNGVDIWKAVDKKGRSYLRVKILGTSVICCFKNGTVEKSAVSELEELKLSIKENISENYQVGNPLKIESITYFGKMYFPKVTAEAVA